MVEYVMESYNSIDVFNKYVVPVNEIVIIC